MRLTMTVKSIDEFSAPIEVTVFTSTTDLRKLLHAVGPWKQASEGLLDLKRGFLELVSKAQLDSEQVARRGLPD